MRDTQESSSLWLQEHRCDRHGSASSPACFLTPHIDYYKDTIDVSNLNRQFLFRQADVGKSKAEVAARFVMQRVKGVNITPYCGKIQDKDEDYYMQFNIVVCGLDSIEARRWINATLVGMVDDENADSLKPLIDGGTEGLSTAPQTMREYR